MSLTFSCSLKQANRNGYNHSSGRVLAHSIHRHFKEVIITSLLLLLSCVSRVQLYGTPQTAAQHSPPSLGFSRQEHWSGLPCLLQCMEVKSESEVAQLCPTLCNPMDCSLPGFSVHGIFQARILKWVAIAFSDNITGSPLTFTCIVARLKEWAVQKWND